MVRALILAAFALTLFVAPATQAQPCCTLPDNGGGTVDLPPNCLDGYDGSLELIEGLPPGSTVEMDARLKNLVLVSQTPGGSLGGTIEVFTGTMELEVTGTGTLAGFSRTLNVSIDGETHSAPRTPGAAVQSFDIEVYRLKGVLTGDYDFSLLWFEGGSVYGLDSPGHTTLTRTGGPGTDFEVESTFEYNYRIQFEGQQESYWIEGWRGITLDLQSDFDLCSASAALGIPETTLPIVAGAAPNPFRGSTQIQFVQPNAGPVRLEIVDVRGNLVRSLVNATLPEGPHSIAWDGRNNQDALAPGGVYFGRVANASGVGGTKLLLMR